MATVAGDLRNILVCSLPAMIAAKSYLVRYRTPAALMFTCSTLCHIRLHLSGGYCDIDINLFLWASPQDATVIYDTHYHRDDDDQGHRPNSIACRSVATVLCHGFRFPLQIRVRHYI